MLLIHKAQHTFCAQYISQPQIPINISILVAYHGGGGGVCLHEAIFPIFEKREHNYKSNLHQQHFFL